MKKSENDCMIKIGCAVRYNTKRARSESDLIEKQNVKLIEEIKNRLRIWLSIPENENTFLVGTTSLYSNERDRTESRCVPLAITREEILEKHLEAWCFNPLARCFDLILILWQGSCQRDE